jgi:sulfite reductase (ferredoxin)
MLFGGSAGEQGELARAIMRVPAKRVIDTVRKIIEIYKQERSGSETLNEWINKIVKGEGAARIKNIENMKAVLTPVAQLRPIEQDPGSYLDYGTDTKFSAKTARGECAA